MEHTLLDVFRKKGFSQAQKHADSKLARVLEAAIGVPNSRVIVGS
jgi:hypothetical protein